METFSGLFSNFSDWAVRLQLRRVTPVFDPQTAQPSPSPAAILYDGPGFALRYNRLSSLGLAPIIAGVAQNVPESLILIPYCALPPLGALGFDVYLPQTRRVYEPTQAPLDLGDRRECWFIACKEQRPALG